MAKQLIAPRITHEDLQPDAFLELSRDLLDEVGLTRDAVLVTDTRRFLGPYLSAQRQQLPRSSQERLDAQILLRRLLVARRCYGLVYGWYAAWKFPYGENAAANLALYIRLLHAALDAYSWVRGYGTVLEVGCGDEALGLMLARCNRRWIASDVRQPDTLEELTRVFAPVGPMEFRIIDGVSLAGVSNSSVDAVVSRSFFEHLLVDDARRHVANAFRALRPGGDFIVYCPAGIGRPSDVTREFPEFDTPLGLHIKEYRVKEMVALLKDAGFARVRSRFVRLRGLSRLPPGVTRRNQVPTAVASIVETCARRTWSIARRSRYGGAIWNQVWGHLGATSVFLVARKLAGRGGIVR